jgi:hypothetical protein
VNPIDAGAAGHGMFRRDALLAHAVPHLPAPLSAYVVEVMSDFPESPRWNVIPITGVW